MSLLTFVALFLLALLANALSAFSGGGAGLVQFPALIFLGLPFAKALATHKVATVALGIGAAWPHWKQGNLDRSLSFMLLLAGVPGVVFGAVSVLHVPESLARSALGLLTLGLGVYSISKSQLGIADQYRGVMLQPLRNGLVLLLLGVLNGSLTSGTGLFVTLFLVRGLGMSYQRAVAHTLIWVGLCWNGSGALALGMVGAVHWPWLLPLLCGAVLGGYCGAHLGLKHGSVWIKRAFEAMSIGIGLSLLVPEILNGFDAL